MASISEAKKLPARPYSHAARWSIDSWAWEILSCSLSIIATVTVAVLVFIYDDKPLPTLPYQIGVHISPIRDQRNKCRNFCADRC